MDPSQTRSPLLQALPRPTPMGNPRRLRRRRSWVAVATGALVLLAVSFKLHWIRGRPGHYFDWIHDEIYLPAKGFLYTWPFPGSLVYVLTAIVFVLFAVVAFLWPRPLTPGFHIRAIRQVLRWRWSHPWLRRWCGRSRQIQLRVRGWAERVKAWPWLERWATAWLSWTTRGSLLEEVIEDERLQALADFDALDPTHSACRQALAAVGATSLLAAHGLAHPPRAPDEPLDAVLHLNQALLRFELARTTRAVEEELPAALHQAIVAELSTLLSPFLPLRLGAPDFSLPRLLGELAGILELRPAANSATTGGGNEWVIEGIDMRRQHLDEARRRLERWFSLGRRRKVPVPRFSELEIPGSRITARLALDLALFGALQKNAPALALAFVESFEALRFMRLLVADEAGEAGDRPVAATADLPLPVDYRVCAELLNRRLSGASDLAAALERRSETIEEADLRLVADRHATLFAAALRRRPAALPAGEAPPEDHAGRL